MNDRYREAAEWHAQQSKALREWASPPVAAIAAHETAARILAKLASGDWVLCDGKAVASLLLTTGASLSLEPGAWNRVREWPTGDYRLHAPIPDLP